MSQNSFEPMIDGSLSITRQQGSPNHYLGPTDIACVFSPSCSLPAVFLKDEIMHRLMRRSG